jgi:hypothetical protein
MFMVCSHLFNNVVGLRIKETERESGKDWAEFLRTVEELFCSSTFSYETSNKSIATANFYTKFRKKY